MLEVGRDFLGAKSNLAVGIYQVPVDIAENGAAWQKAKIQTS